MAAAVRVPERMNSRRRQLNTRRRRAARLQQVARRLWVLVAHSQPHRARAVVAARQRAARDQQAARVNVAVARSQVERPPAAGGRLGGGHVSARVKQRGDAVCVAAERRCQQRARAGDGGAGVGARGEQQSQHC